MGIEKPGGGTVRLFENGHLIENRKEMAASFDVDLRESAVDGAIEKEKKDRKKKDDENKRENGHQRKSEVNRCLRREITDGLEEGKISWKKESVEMERWWGEGVGIEK
jgi:hypothetical protein